ncbi:MAG: hypothetical protein HY905_06170 [Deltaproteobacteria bacterium]|nr:hypothetical protein [Deltaproteobacteria bacterium]
MMKLRPKVLDTGKMGGLGGPGTWIPVGIVVVAVALHLFNAMPAVWAALPVAGALLYTMGEPVLLRLFRQGQYPGWARAAALVLIATALAWAGFAVWRWTEGGDVVAEGDLTTTEDALALAPTSPGETRDYLLELSVSGVPEAGKKKAMTFPFTMRVGQSDVRGNFGTERVRRRFACAGGEQIRTLDHSYHHLHLALDPKRDKLRLGSLVREPADAPSKPEDLEKVTLHGPVHVRLTEAPIPRLVLYLVSVGLLLLASVVEAFEDRSRKEKARPAMLVGGLLAATAYFLSVVNPDNLLMGVLGCALAGLVGAIVAFVTGFLALKLIPARKH